MKKTDRTTPLIIAELVLSAATVLLAALLIFQCANIYITGTSPQNLTEAGVYIRPVYSRELVADGLKSISWAFIVWLVALCTAIALRIANPKGKRASMQLSTQSRLALLRERVVPTGEMQAEVHKRRIAAILCGAVCLVCAAFVGVYLFFGNHFVSRDLEAVMGAMMLAITPWIVIAFAVLMVFAWLKERSLRRELEAAMQAPKRTPQPQGQKRFAFVPIARIALYLAAAVLLIEGIRNGGMYDVLVKAINICTECIGIG